MYKLFIDGLLMPVFPDETVITRGDYTTITRLADGYDIAVFSPPAPDEIDFSLDFPATDTEFATWEGGFIRPGELYDAVTLLSGRPFRVIAAAVGDDGSLSDSYSFTATLKRATLKRNNDGSITAALKFKRYPGGVEVF